jgi:hypothetical protein
VGDSKTVIGGAPELFGPLFEHAQRDGLVAGVGAVVTACQRVGIRSHVQRLSRPRRADRRGRGGRRQRRRDVVAINGTEPEGVVATEALASASAVAVAQREPRPEPAAVAPEPAPAPAPKASRTRRAPRKPDPETVPTPPDS